MTLPKPHYVRPPHHELPKGNRYDAAGHDGTSLNRSPRPSTAPAGLFAPAPEVVREKVAKPPKKRAPRAKVAPAQSAREPAKCGTDSGYKKHWRDKTPKCQPCTEAHRIAARQYDSYDRDRRVYVRPDCGTEAGVAEHARRKERMCDQCRGVGAQAA